MGAVIPAPIAGIPDPASSRRRIIRATVSLALVMSSCLRLRLRSITYPCRRGSLLVTMELGLWQVADNDTVKGRPGVKECPARVSDIFYQ